MQSLGFTKFIHLHIHTHSRTQNLNNTLLDLGWARNNIPHWANTSQYPFNSVHNRTCHHSGGGWHRIRLHFMPHYKMLRIKVAVIKEENRILKGWEPSCTTYNWAVFTDETRNKIDLSPRPLQTANRTHHHKMKYNRKYASFNLYLYSAQQGRNFHIQAATLTEKFG